MNKKELALRLEKENIRPSCYAIEPPYSNNECLCLVNEGIKWKVYYAERGSQSNIRFFNKEEDACQFFYEKLINSETNRI